MVSFDVVSLFTRVPVDDALLVIARLLQEDTTLTGRTSIPPNDLCALIQLCLEATYFHFRGTFYQQVQGAAMGSPLSPIVANLFMEDFERRALLTSPCMPRLWIRYVDDVFAVWPQKDRTLKDFHLHLNKQHPSIQFTMEEEDDNKIAFLDVLVRGRTPLMAPSHLCLGRRRTLITTSTLDPTTTPE